MYFVKSKRGPFRLRDADSGKMQDVGPRAWVPFGRLPAGMSLEFHTDLSISQPKTQQDLDAIEADNARMKAEDDAALAKRKAKSDAKPEKPAERPDPEPEKHGKRWSRKG